MLTEGGSDGVRGGRGIGGEAEERVPSAIKIEDRATAPAGRWLMWSVLAIAYLIVVFHRIAPGVVADRLMAEFAVGGAAVGILTSIYFWLYAVMQVPAGTLADTLGARKTVAAGTALAGLGSLVFAVAPSMEAAYLGRFLVGLGVSVVFVAAMKFQVNWFRAREFGTVSGLLMLVGNLGSIVATTPVAVMAQLFGWRLSFGIIGAATCALALAVWSWVRDHPPELAQRDQWGGPTGAGHVDGVARRATTADLLAASRDVWRSRQTVAGFLAHFGLAGSYLTFVGLWGVPYLMHVYGMDRSQAANYLLVASVGIVVSAPLAGYLSDRFFRRRKRPLLGLGALACLFWVAMSLWNGGRPPEWALYPLFGAVGFSTGSVTLILSAVKEAHPPRLAGTAMGAANGGFLCAAILQPALGYLLDGYWQGALVDGARVYPLAGYQVAMMVMGSFALVGFLGAAMMKETYCRNLPQG